MPTPPKVQIKVNAYSVRKPKSLDSYNVLTARIDHALVDFENLTIELRSGDKARFNPFYNSLNDYKPDFSKPIEYKPMWLHKVDDHIWYEARYNDSPDLTRYVRKENNMLIDHKTGQSLPKDAVTLVEPNKKMLRCIHTVITPNGSYFRTTRFVYETPKFYIYRNLDGSKIKYTKKVAQDDPIGFIDLDDENVLFLYPSEDF